MGCIRKNMANVLDMTTVLDGAKVKVSEELHKVDNETRRLVWNDLSRNGDIRVACSRQTIMENKPLVPLFNVSKPKRPRQALFSGPCDSQPSEPKQYSAISDFGSKANVPSLQPGNPIKGFQNKGQSDLLPPKPNLPQYKSQKGPKPGPYGDGQSAGRGNMYCSKGANSHNPSQTRMNMGNGRPQGQNNFQNRTNTIAREPLSGTNKQVSRSGQTSFYTNQSQGNENPSTASQYQNHSKLNQSQFGSNSHSKAENVRVQSRPMADNSGGFNTQAYNQARRQKSGNSPAAQPSTSSGQTSTKIVPRSSSKKSIEDKSLRVFTATIQSVQQWGKSQHSIPAIFEVYGLIESAVTTNSFTNSKHFMLKDETGVMPCVFFEIDRVVGRLTRSQWHRCMGTFDKKLQKFKCVSVRPSSQSERHLAKQSLNISEEAMKTLINQLRES